MTVVAKCCIGSGLVCVAAGMLCCCTMFNCLYSAYSACYTASHVAVNELGWMFAVCDLGWVFAVFSFHCGAVRGSGERQTVPPQHAGLMDMVHHTLTSPYLASHKSGPDLELTWPDLT